MGGSSLKKVFFGKKKKSPLNRAWSELKRVLPEKKTSRKRKLSVDKLRMGKKSQKRSSLTPDKVSTALKRLSLGHTRKDSFQNASAGRKEKDRGGLGRVGGQIKNPFCQDNKKAGDAPQSDTSKEENQDKKKLKKIVRLNWSKGSKANREIP